MNEMTLYLVVTGAFLAIAYPLGCRVAVLQGRGRWLSVVVGLAGTVLFTVGIIGSGIDRRFHFVASAGLCFQFASLVGSIRSRSQITRPIDLTELPASWSGRPAGAPHHQEGDTQSGALRSPRARSRRYGG